MIPGRRLLLSLALAAVASPEAGAQELAPAPPRQYGGFFVPMLTVAEAADDNVFFTQFPESDLVTRLTAGLETGYRSRPFTIDLQGNRSADRFERHPDFDTNQARTLGQVSLQYLPARPLTISAFACYLDTQTPSELNTVTGLSLGRSLATRLTATPMAEYRLGAYSTLTGAFQASHDTLDGKITDTRTGIFGFDRRITRRDSLGVRYERRWFGFSGAYIPEETIAHVATVGWLGEVGERTIVVLRAGPRFERGSVKPEVLATLKKRVKHGFFSVAYTKTQATTLAKTGALDTQSLVASFALRVSKKFELASGPGVYRNSLRGNELHAMRLNLEALWHFSAWFHLGAMYSFDLQQPDFGAPGKIRRNVLQVRLVTSPQQRRPEEPDWETPQSEIPQQERN